MCWGAAAALLLVLGSKTCCGQAEGGLEPGSSQVQASNAAAVRTQEASLNMEPLAVEAPVAAFAPAGLAAPAPGSDVVYTSDAYAPSDDPRQVNQSRFFQMQDHGLLRGGGNPLWVMSRF
jgi:hypothetical protein